MKPDAVACHATAVSIDGRGLLIVGASRSGKSRLALDLIAASTDRRPIQLIGDDRVLLSSRVPNDVEIKPHPRIAGFIERRGLGIVAMPHVARGKLTAIVSLAQPSEPAPQWLPENFPVLSFVHASRLEERCALTLRWFAGLDATNEQHPSSKTPSSVSRR